MRLDVKREQLELEKMRLNAKREIEELRMRTKLLCRPSTININNGIINNNYIFNCGDEPEHVINSITKEKAIEIIESNKPLVTDLATILHNNPDHPMFMYIKCADKENELVIYHNDKKWYLVPFNEISHLISKNITKAENKVKDLYLHPEDPDNQIQQKRKMAIFHPSNRLGSANLEYEKCVLDGLSIATEDEIIKATNLLKAQS